jgi:trehalose/maltose hydrolase-like predicted phosphorylase
MSWTITETNQLDDRATDRLGNTFLLGNGYFGYRGTLEEYTKEQKPATIVSGLYDQVGDLWREPINFPNGGFIQVVYQNRPLHAKTSRVEQHSQTLDIYQAVHDRHTVFLTEDGNRLIVHARRFVSATRLHLLCIEYTIEASRNCELVIHSGIDGDVWDLNGPHLCNFKSEVHGSLISLTAISQEMRIPIAVCESVVGPGDPHTYAEEGKRILRQIHLRVNANQPQTLHKFVALHTAKDTDNPQSAGESLCQEAARVGFDPLLKEHCAFWEARWKSCDIQITGDAEAQLALRFSMYHLLAVAPTHTDRASIPARGLSGQVYKGGIFWDTEIFMLPFLTFEFPEIARNLLMYRYHTLDGARRKAREYGFRGAYYAWESQDTGDDACTLFNVADVFTKRPIRTFFRDKQVHISADIAHAIWTYYSITGDDTLFLDGGAEVIYECSRFLLTRLYYSREKDRYEILDVTGPDEYHERVHNNTFTNWMAVSTLKICLDLSAYLQERYPAQAEALMEKIDFQEDLEAIREVSGQMYQPAPDPQTMIIPQFDGYFALEDVPLKALLQRKLDPYEYLGGGNGLATTTQIIKQADVILSLVLSDQEYSREALAANWEYYEPRTEEGSSLSACSYAIIAAQIGKVDAAYKYFMTTATIDLTGDSKQYVGPLYIGGTHPAANGGAWMAVVLGFCGIHWSGPSLTIDPHLPALWSEVKVPLTIHGQSLQLTVSKHEVTIQAVQPLQVEILIQVRQEIYSLSEREKLTIPLPESERKP